MGTKTKRLNTSPYRVLLSEVMPYELPIFFSMKSLYKFADRTKLKFDSDGRKLEIRRNKYKKDLNLQSFLDIINGDTKRPKKSFGYYINKDEKETGRRLTLIHPYNALKMVFFYQEHAGQILNSCNRSLFSLRFPHRVAAAIRIKRPIVPTLVKKFITYKITDPRTYFVYKDFNNINSFYDSKRFLRLQSQFRKYYKSDIHHCFDSIPAERLYEAAYLTHNSSPAVNNFATEFQKLMSEMREGDKGILIGPEFSRIYAEIILQKIDKEVRDDMDKSNERFRIDYECFRYLDDMFFFYNSDKSLSHFKKIYSDHLMKWGMEPNTKKEEMSVTPFITPQTIAKREIEKVIKEVFQNRLVGTVIDGSENYATPYQINAKDAYNSILSVITRNNIKLYKISSFLLSRLQRESLHAIDVFDEILHQYIKAQEEVMLDEKGRQILQSYMQSMVNFLQQIIRFAFLIFESDIRMSTSIKVASIIDGIILYANKRLFFGNQITLPSQFCNSIYKYVRDEVTHLLKSHDLQQFDGLEICNLLAVMSDLPESYALSNTVLNNFANNQFSKEYFGEEGNHGVNFLMAFALMQSLKKVNSNLKQEIYDWLLNRLDFKKWDCNDAECCYIIIGLSYINDTTLEANFFEKAKDHQIHIPTKSNQNLSFMQWQGVTLQKACSEKVSANVY